jgi:hypothetical protein
VSKPPSRGQSGGHSTASHRPGCQPGRPGWPGTSSPWPEAVFRPGSGSMWPPGTPRSIGSSWQGPCSEHASWPASPSACSVCSTAARARHRVLCRPRKRLRRQHRGQHHPQPGVGLNVTLEAPVQRMLRSLGVGMEFRSRQHLPLDRIVIARRLSARFFVSKIVPYWGGISGRRYRLA